MHVSVGDEKKNTYVALNGRARLSTDISERRRLWTPLAGAWFEGAEDPTLGVIHFTIDDGEYWDGPSGVIGRTLDLVRAVISKNDDALGEHGTVRID